MCRDFIRNQDLFAAPVYLTYKGERAFNTAFGGCCSILFVLYAIAMVATGAISLWKNAKIAQNTSHAYLTYSHNEYTYNLTSTYENLMGAFAGDSDE